MAKSIGTLTLDLIANLGGFTKGMNKAERETKTRTDKMRKSLKQTRDSINKLGGAVGTAASVAGVGFAAMVKSTTTATDALVKMSARLGVTAEDMQRLNFIAGRTGVAGETIAKSMQRVERQLGKVGGPTKLVQGAMDGLGLSIDEVSKLSPEEQFFTIAEALQNVEDRTKRAGISYEIFGRQGEQLAGVIATSGDQLRELAGNFDEFNVSLSNVQGQNIEALADDFHDVDTVLTSVRQRFVAELSPSISAFIDEVFLAGAKTGELGEAADEAAQKFVRGFAFALNVVDSLKRLGEVAFNGLELGVLIVTERVLNLADSIINGPVEALNALLGLANKIPGVEIELFDQSSVGDGIEETLDFVRDRIAEKAPGVFAPLEEALLGDRVLERMAEAATAAGEAVETSLAPAAETLERMGDAASPIDQSIEALQQQVDQLGKAGTALELYKLMAMGANEAQLELAATLLGQVEAFNQAKELQTSFEEYQQSLLTEEELLQQSYDTRLEKLAEFHEAKLLSEEEYRLAVQEAEEEHDEALKSKRGQGLSAIEKLVGQQMNKETKLVAGAMKDQLASVAQNSKKGFEIMKAVRTAEAITNTYSAAMGAYNAMAGIPYIGPALGAAAAAAAIAYGFQQVSAIQSMSFNGGGGGGGGAPPGTPSIGAAASAAPAQQTASQQNVVLNVDGGITPDSLFTGETVLGLIDAINEAGENGARLVVAGS